MVKIDISAYFSCSIKIALSHNSYPLLKIRVKFAYKSQETMRITKENTSTVIIDIQERLFPHMYNREELEHNVQILMKGLKLLNIPILITEQYSKGAKGKKWRQYEYPEYQAYGTAPHSSFCSPKPFRTVYGNNIIQYGNDHHETSKGPDRITRPHIKSHASNMQSACSAIDSNGMTCAAVISHLLFELRYFGSLS